MTNDNEVEVTNVHLVVARKYGESIAAVHKNVLEKDGAVTEDELFEEHSEADVVWIVAGEKLHNVPEYYLIIEEFEDGYFYSDVWDNDVD